MTKHLDIGRVTAAIKAAMVKTFTADELKALADFYGSEVGRSAMAKMGDLYVGGHARHHERGPERARKSGRRGAPGASC